MSRENHTVTILSFEDEEEKIDPNVHPKTPEGKEKRKEQLMEDFEKNIEYYGSMDHFLQLEYENSLMR